jgi:DNA ligase-1
VLGAFTVRDGGVEFSVGTGFTYEDRTQFWRRRHELIGSIITYEYLPIGVKDKPRHPVFLGFRMQEDV